MTCNRCKAEIKKKGLESCWYCGAWLCKNCFADPGHCGHSQAEAITKMMMKVKEKDGDLK